MLSPGEVRPGGTDGTRSRPNQLCGAEPVAAPRRVPGRHAVRGRRRPRRRRAGPLRPARGTRRDSLDLRERFRV